MSVIYKTKIDPNAAHPFAQPFSVKLPRGAVPLTMQMQDGYPTVWWVCSEEEPIEERRLRILGTGWKFNSREIGKYFGTWQEAGYVWHLWESTI